ncbi:MAG: GmrSD restriction endonuclease domain-containing protein [Arachnia sp.]
MRSAGTRWSRGTTWGLGALIAVAIIGAGSAGPWAGLGFAALLTILTGIYHVVLGRSWANPFLPRGRRGGAVLLLGGLVVLFVAAAASPDAQPPIPARPSPSSDAPAAPTTPPAPSPTTVAPNPTPTPTAAPPSTTLPATPDPDLALSVLETLPIKGRAPKTGYDRALFGQTWADVDRNGCDTRNDILARDLSGRTTQPSTRDCVVLTGALIDPYTGTAIDFVRGQDTSTEVQIDHVVALSDAWQKGAQQLDIDTRTLFANDPLNLLAVQGSANLQKSDGDAATWLPSNKAFRCDYVARQVAVKARYSLWVTQAEHDGILRVLSECPGKKIPVTSDTVSPPGTPPASSVEPSTPVAETEPTHDVHYENCTAAREAGAAPLLRGEPGYRSGMDGDDDGVACE